MQLYFSPKTCGKFFSPLVVISTFLVIFSEVLKKLIPRIFKANNSERVQNAAKALNAPHQVLVALTNECPQHLQNCSLHCSCCSAFCCLDRIIIHKNQRTDIRSNWTCVMHRSSQLVTGHQDESLGTRDLISGLCYGNCYGFSVS